MTTLRMMVAVVLLVAADNAIAQPFGDGFATGNLSDYLADAARLKPEQASLQSADGMLGKRCLRLSGAPPTVFKEVSVDPDKKYTLRFRARHEGGESVEENPRWDLFTAYGRVPAVVPQRELQFLDASKKPLGSMASGMPFRKWQEYRDIFYPPAGAAFLRLQIASGKAVNALYLDDVILEPAPDEGSINVNPVIGKYGLYNYSGWLTPSAGGKIIQLDDGRIVFDTKYGTSSPSFPLAEPGTYCLFARSQDNGYNSVVILSLLDESGKKIESVDLRRYGVPRYFVLPPGARRGSFLVYSNLLEELRLSRVGDAGEIKNLQKP